MPGISESKHGLAGHFASKCAQRVSKFGVVKYWYNSMHWPALTDSLFYVSEDMY